MTAQALAYLKGRAIGFASGIRASSYPPERFICAKFGHVFEGVPGVAPCARCGEESP